MNDRTATLRDGLLGALPLAAIVGLWQVIVLAGLAPPALLPAPDAVLMRLVQQLGSSAYLDHVATTLGRLFAGFGIAVMVGVGLGLAATGSRWAGGVIAPLVRVLAPVPKIALYPALVLTLGFEDASKIALVVADAVFPDSAGDGAGNSGGRTETRVVGAGGRRVAAALPAHRRAAGGIAGDPDRLPHRAGDLLHRGVPGRDDHLD